MKETESDFLHQALAEVDGRNSAAETVWRIAREACHYGKADIGGSV
jgi:hypothetical protein